MNITLAIDDTSLDALAVLMADRIAAHSGQPANASTSQPAPASEEWAGPVPPDPWTGQGGSAQNTPQTAPGAPQGAPQYQPATPVQPQEGQHAQSPTYAPNAAQPPQGPGASYAQGAAPPSSAGYGQPAVTPSCQHGPMRYVPGGYSKRTGKPYPPFWSCPTNSGDPTKCRNVTA